MIATLPSLLKAEWRKATSTKIVWILVLVSIGVNALSVLLYTRVIPGDPSLAGMDPLMIPGYIQTTLAIAGGAAVFVLIIGIIGMTSEYRHMTITSTFLATPRRGRVAASKGILYALIGAAVAVINVVAMLIATILLLIGLDHAPITAGMVGKIVLGTLLGLALYGILGVSIGALLRNQVAAIIIALVWIFIVEPVVGLLVPAVAKWLPSGALQAAMDLTTREDLSATDLLPVWGGALLLLGYAVCFGFVASLTTLRRDIT